MHKLRNGGEEQTTAYKLFNKRYLVRVQNKAFYTPFELEEIGFTSCGSVKENEIYLSEYRLINTTLDKIVEWNGRGDSIRLTNLLDATEMFHIMDKHMDNWLKVTATYPTAILPPIEDFEFLDLLCEMLYPLVDIDINTIDDPNLFMLFGNAINIGHVSASGVQPIKEPYVHYSPKLYGYTKFRWEK